LSSNFASHSCQKNAIAMTAIPETFRGAVTNSDGSLNNAVKGHMYKDSFAPSATLKKKTSYIVSNLSGDIQHTGLDTSEPNRQILLVESEPS